MKHIFKIVNILEIVKHFFLFSRIPHSLVDRITYRSLKLQIFLMSSDDERPVSKLLHFQKNKVQNLLTLK